MYLNLCSIPIVAFSAGFVFCVRWTLHYTEDIVTEKYNFHLKVAEEHGDIFLPL